MKDLPSSSFSLFHQISPHCALSPQNGSEYRSYERWIFQYHSCLLPIKTILVIIQISFCLDSLEKTALKSCKLLLSSRILEGSDAKTEHQMMNKHINIDFRFRCQLLSLKVLKGKLKKSSRSICV